MCEALEMDIVKLENHIELLYLKKKKKNAQPGNCPHSALSGYATIYF